jgi:hypothetical protein
MLKMDDCTSSESDTIRDSDSSPDREKSIKNSKSGTDDSMSSSMKQFESSWEHSDHAPSSASTSSHAAVTMKASEDVSSEKHDDYESSSLHLFTIRVIFFDGSTIPCGNFSPVDIRDLIIANCLQSQRIENMPLIDALALENGYIIGDTVLIINWPNDDSVVKFANPSERIFFPGNIYWNHWKQFYPDFECISRNNNSKTADAHSGHGSTNNESMQSSSSSQSRADMQLNMFRRRILLNPTTMQPYNSHEMKENISYLKSEYKIRDYRDEASMKNFLRFLLETFAQEIKNRLVSMQQRTQGMHHSSSDGSNHHPYENYHVRQV